MKMPTPLMRLFDEAYQCCCKGKRIEILAGMVIAFWFVVIGALAVNASVGIDKMAEDDRSIIIASLSKKQILVDESVSHNTVVSDQIYLSYRDLQLLMAQFKIWLIVVGALIGVIQGLVAFIFVFSRRAMKDETKLMIDGIGRRLTDHTKESEKRWGNAESDISKLEKAKEDVIKNYLSKEDHKELCHLTHKKGSKNEKDT